MSRSPQIEAFGWNGLPVIGVAEEVVALVDKIEAEVGDIHVAVFNIGANVNFSILETTARVYFKVLLRCCSKKGKC